MSTKNILILSICIVSVVVIASPVRVVLNYAEAVVRTTRISQIGRTIVTQNKLAQPLKTGQLKCYQINGAVTTCAGTGQDAAYQLGIATSTTDNGNNTISDNATGLMWVKDHNALGAPFNAAMSWNNATSSCESLSLAGYTDWRLPNIRELQSLVDFGRVSPSIDPIKFPNTQLNYYWSATTYVSPGLEGYAWNVDFYGGIAYVDNKTSSYYVRCTRGIR